MNLSYNLLLYNNFMTNVIINIILIINYYYGHIVTNKLLL